MDPQPPQAHTLPVVHNLETLPRAGSFTAVSPTATKLRQQKRLFRQHEFRILETVRLLNESDLSNNQSYDFSTVLHPKIKNILLATSKSSSKSSSTFSSTVKLKTPRLLALGNTATSASLSSLSDIDTMSTREAHLAYLRPAIIHTLRASGFHAARPAALDSLVDLTARYLEVLAVRTKDFAALTSNSSIPSITDARNALEYAGALKPSMGAAEEQLYGDDDLRGVHSFISWFDSAQCKQIRRVAGLEGGDVSTNGVALPGDEMVGKEDYLAKLKKKHSQTGDQERFRGTMLGGEMPAQKRIIEGGGPTSIAAWRAKMMGEEILEEDDDQEDTESG